MNEHELVTCYKNLNKQTEGIVASAVTSTNDYMGSVKHATSTGRMLSA